MSDCGDAADWPHDNIYESALALLSDLARKVAPEKNVPLTSANAVAYVAEQAGEALELADHYRLLRVDRGASERAAQAVQRAIDEWYFLLVARCIVEYFGVPDALRSYAPIFVKRSLDLFHGAATPPVNYQWPPCDEFAAQALAVQPFTDIGWKLPDGRVCFLNKRFWKEPCPSNPATEHDAALPEWQLASEVHCPASEGPAVQTLDASGEVVHEAYVEHGKCHRDPAEGPAFFQRVDDQGAFRLITEYWVNGEMHRPSAQGPAVIEIGGDGRVLLEIYAEHGKRHRDPRQGPAFFQVKEVDGEELHITEYWYEGQQHRPSHEGPAVLITRRDGTPVTTLFFEHGKLHRDPSVGPARVEHVRNEAYVIEEFFFEGQPHRPAHIGPAMTGYQDGICTLQVFYEHGKYHRDPAHGPALTLRDLAGGRWLYEYRVNGGLHRPEADGPAVVETDGDGRVTYECYYAHDRIHRENGPAAVAYDETGRVASADHWRNGECLSALPLDLAVEPAHGA